MEQLMSNQTNFLVFYVYFKHSVPDTELSKADTLDKLPDISHNGTHTLIKIILPVFFFDSHDS